MRSEEAGTPWGMSPATHPLIAGAHGYDSGECFDEAFDDSGRPRPQYEEILGHLESADLDALTTKVRTLLDEEGVAFGGEDGHPFCVDPVPRILTTDEWSGLSEGLCQRVRALDAFLEDVYGEQRVVAEGIVPAHVVTGSAYFEKDLVGVPRSTGARIGLAGLDVVRDRAGGFRVLEDNVRTPSGIAYAMAASDVLQEVLPVRRPTNGARQTTVDALRGAMESSAPGVEGELVLLTDGPENSAWYEHQRLAKMADLQLATPGELRRKGTRIELADGRRVRAVYRRTGEDRVREESGAFTPLAELLVDPLAAGEVGVVNWFGNGVADDKNLYMYVDELVRFYLGEEPLVRSVPTHDLTDPERLDEVIDRLDELVVKPRNGQGGDGVVVGPTASADEIAKVRAAVRKSPDEWIAQDVVSLSTHPTVVEGRLVPRHVDLRPFVFFDGRQAVVPEGGLTRVAMQEGSMVVNSSQDGGGKATWVA
ncbi:MAG TPA: circularly permuted type 2 ATP-grasp protein [Nocardioidaceae bacterium]|nr:circularly permuted type 2 ATP-grasp protein [Nocardioidaceae bacterium]